ncbi:MAG TPA: TrkA family potassium uptake protein [Dehalococcoidia bacterium]|nr:TrkA family potassium uptake protein [Dehalococcoidia bacterium]
MYIIIVGGGKVGFYLASELVAEGHEILVIEQEPAKVARINDELGDVAVQGDGCEAAVLENAGTGRADMFIAVTGDDEDNLVSCQVARKKFDVPRTIARLNNPKNALIFKKLGIDTTVSATAAIMAHIEQELPTHHLIPLLSLRGSGLQIVEAQITDDSPSLGRKLNDLLLPQQTLIALVIDAGGHPHVPNAETQLSTGDKVLAVTRPDAEDTLRQILIG